MVLVLCIANDADPLLQRQKQTRKRRSQDQCVFKQTKLIRSNSAAQLEGEVVAPTLELIGVGYSAWFISRYLLTLSTRQELAQKLDGILKQQD